MWTLWIVSTVIGSAEPKWTRYDQFEHFETCEHAALVVEKKFTQDELAVCEKVDDK